MAKNIDALIKRYGSEEAIPLKANNGAYYRDIKTGEFLSPETPRPEKEYSLPHCIHSDGTVTLIAFSFWTEEEKKHEYETKKASKGTGTPRGTAKPDEHDIRLDAILEKLKKAGCKEDLLKEVESLRHKTKDPWLASLPEGDLELEKLGEPIKQVMPKIVKFGLEERFKLDKDKALISAYKEIMGL